jgi:hypothetical protein
MPDRHRPISGAMRKGGKATLELKPGEPFLGQEGPPGAKFLGWVLVQVWDVPEGRDGCVVQLSSTTGEHQRLMERAVAKLNHAWPRTH